MNANKIIVHFPYPLTGHAESGSSLRPLRILEALRGRYEVTLICGSCTERKNAFEKVISEVERGVEYSFCYSESSTMPTNFACGKWSFIRHYDIDFRFFSWLSSRDIPVGVFLRDIYWMYSGVDAYPALKRLVYKYEYRRDLRKYSEFCSVLFVPSDRFAQVIAPFVDVRMVSLPPGLAGRACIPKLSGNRLNLIYVGGMGEFYNFRSILSCLSSMLEVKITLVTREEEWNQKRSQYSQYLRPGRVERLTASGQDLEQLYKNADIALLFFEANPYRELAMPYKLFEYLDYEKPIITNIGTSAADFIGQHDLGWVLASENEVVECLNVIAARPEIIEEKIKNIKKIKAGNTWENRAFQIGEVLSIQE